MPAAEKPVALVTGAAKRVGSVIARTLAQEGYRVALHAHRSLAAADELARSLGDAIAVGADLRDQSSLQAMVQAVVDAFGRIDALVNSAAVWSPRRLEETTADDLGEHLAVNTVATFLCCRQVGQIMAQQSSGGAIVNFGDWAIARPYPDYSAYFVSKGTIPTLTRTLAVELGQRNPQVRVNAILPGPVLLPEGMSPAERQAAIDATLVRREGRPENVAHAVLFLLENDFVTGVCLPVDGGRSIFGASF